MSGACSFQEKASRAILLAKLQTLALSEEPDASTVRLRQRKWITAYTGMYPYRLPQTHRLHMQAALDFLCGIDTAYTSSLAQQLKIQQRSARCGRVLVTQTFKLHAGIAFSDSYPRAKLNGPADGGTRHFTRSGCMHWARILTMLTGA
jgi:hypothetical protein